MRRIVHFFEPSKSCGLHEEPLGAVHVVRARSLLCPDIRNEEIRWSVVCADVLRGLVDHVHNLLVQHE